jgi:ubiquinone/menaquinone biosynthesis C-methylase UbiE
MNDFQQNINSSEPAGARQMNVGPHPHVGKHQPASLENPARVAELMPEKTLRRLGFADGQVLCDIGAGSGLFALPAARMTRQKVLALDINPAMLATIRSRAQEAGLSNLELIPVDGPALNVAAGSVDLALLVTVLHEVLDKPPFIAEIRRILRPGGRLAVIEFFKARTPLGPPPAERLSPQEVTDLVLPAGFTLAEQFELGPNFYCQIFTTVPAR